MRIHYVGHSTFIIETSSHRLVIDPYFEQNPVSRMKAKDISCDFVLVSHGHDDHCADAVKLATRNDATIIANYEIAEFFAKQGAKTHAMNPGGAHEFPFGRVKLTQAIHTSSTEVDGVNRYMGVPCGLLISADGKNIFHAGDTALFSDLKLYARPKLDVAMLPIGDNYTMGPDDALVAMGFLKPRLTIPMHYNTWPVIAQDADAFARRAKRKKLKVQAMKPGEEIEL
jgi:L-ascorbate metabolism protein UlaG (beta-lactamase superfamily)